MEDCSINKKRYLEWELNELRILEFVGGVMSYLIEINKKNESNKIKEWIGMERSVR